MCNEDNCPTPYGYCHCGCGAKTNINRSARPSRGIGAGEPSAYRNGHSNRKRLNEMYEIDLQTGCWNWKGEISTSGYGRYAQSSENQRVWRGQAHRFVFEAIRGEIPRGLVLDHLCRNKRCVNPDHLEPVPQRENVRRGRAAKLNTSSAAFIKAHTDWPDWRLAERFDVHPRTIRAVWNGEQWCDVVPETTKPPT